MIRSLSNGWIFTKSSKGTTLQPTIITTDIYSHQCITKSSFGMYERGKERAMNKQMYTYSCICSKCLMRSHIAQKQHQQHGS